MSWIRVWAYLVFSTKYPHRILKPLELRQELFNHIKKNAKQKNLFIEIVNGYEQK